MITYVQKQGIWFVRIKFSQKLQTATFTYQKLISKFNFHSPHFVYYQVLHRAVITSFTNLFNNWQAFTFLIH